MSYKMLELEYSYISKGNEDIANAFLVPALKYTKIYKRSVGFFSSSVFNVISEGISDFVQNEGKMQIIASPNLSVEDINTIQRAYNDREKIVKEIITAHFVRQLELVTYESLQLLYQLIVNNILDIKIAVLAETYGMYHDKLGIMEDLDGNIIAFVGSSNSSQSGYKYNYEKIRLFKSWNGDEERINDELAEFDNLWNGNNEFVDVLEYQDVAKQNILKVIERKGSKNKTTEVEQATEINTLANTNTIVLRDYQKQAIDAWINNGYNGFYVMATGTGKTWTAIYSAVALMERNEVLMVICAPYKHLLSQWKSDIKDVFKDATIIIISSENPDWEIDVKDAIIGKKYNPSKQIILISTLKSFVKDRFLLLLESSNEDKLLIVDEAHRFTTRPSRVNSIFKFMLGLSATPFSGTNTEKGKELLAFFKGQVFSLDIEEALEKGYLVPYNYYPIYVNANASEEENFNIITRKMMSCYRDGVCIDKDKAIKLSLSRLRVISMLEEKKTKFLDIMKRIPDKSHFIVYCGDGRVVSDRQETLRHIESVNKEISEKLGLKASKFTASETMKERMELIEMFDQGRISTLTAIRCLDEGINIPSIKSALILSSNDNYREFVQRRGRILRKHDGKHSASIYDVISLPSVEMDSWAKIELRRYYEYAKLAQNWDEIEVDFNRLLIKYNIEISDIGYNYYEPEEAEDDE